MPNPYQKVPRQWPKKIKDKCFDMFVQGYTAPEIEKVTGVPANTLYAWSGDNVHRNCGNWQSIRREAVTDYRARVVNMLQSASATLCQSITVASKILNRIECQLDSSMPSSGLETTPSEAKPLSNLVPPVALADLAKALRDSSDVLLRIFDK